MTVHGKATVNSDGKTGTRLEGLRRCRAHPYGSQIEVYSHGHAAEATDYSDSHGRRYPNHKTLNQIHGSNKGLHPTTHNWLAMRTLSPAAHLSGIVGGSRMNPDVVPI